MPFLTPRWPKHPHNCNGSGYYHFQHPNSLIYKHGTSGWCVHVLSTLNLFTMLPFYELPSKAVSNTATCLGPNGAAAHWRWARGGARAAVELEGGGEGSSSESQHRTQSNWTWEFEGGGASALWGSHIRWFIAVAKLQSRNSSKNNFFGWGERTHHSMRNYMKGLQRQQGWESPV